MRSSDAIPSSESASRKKAKTVFSLFNLKDRSRFWSEAVIRGATSTFSSYFPISLINLLTKLMNQSMFQFSFCFCFCFQTWMIWNLGRVEGGLAITPRQVLLLLLLLLVSLPLQLNFKIPLQLTAGPPPSNSTQLNSTLIGLFPFHSLSSYFREYRKLSKPSGSWFSLPSHSSQLHFHWLPRQRKPRYLSFLSHSHYAFLYSFLLQFYSLPPCKTLSFTPKKSSAGSQKLIMSLNMLGFRKSDNVSTLLSTRLALIFPLSATSITSNASVLIINYK